MLRHDESAGKQECQPSHLQAWQCGMQAYDILREGWLSWRDVTSAGTMQVPTEPPGCMCHVWLCWLHPCSNHRVSYLGPGIFAQSGFSVKLTPVNDAF